LRQVNARLGEISAQIKGAAGRVEIIGVGEIARSPAKCYKSARDPQRDHAAPHPAALRVKDHFY